MLCDCNIEKYIRKNNYTFLNKCTPTERFSEKFRLETESVKIKINPDDEIIGWFYFDKKCNEDVVFDDEKLSYETQCIIKAPEQFKIRTVADRGHTLADYESILKNGLVSYEQRIEKELNKNPKNEYLLAMKSSLNSVYNFLKRIEDAVNQKILTSDECEKTQLISLKKIIKKVPFYPAESFREAVQSVWIIHFLIPLAENSWSSISLGRFDKYMYPFYKNSLDNGMTKKDAKKILYNFYKLLNSYADGACLLNIGPSYNELSELIIECQKEFEMPSPILGARIDETTPDYIWNQLIDEKLFSMGQPTFYGEKSCINALTEKGLPYTEAKLFSNNSCMGIGMAGNEFNSMWGCIFSVHSSLEMAVDCGRLSNGNTIIVPEIKAPNNVDELFNNFEICAKYLLDICVKAYEKQAEISEKIFPDPFVSLLTHGCIEKHCDRISGAKYHNVSFECMGMVNASDGIYAIDKLVFRDRKYKLKEINRAVKNNFINYENIRNDIMKCSKFGENSEADVYAIRVAEILQKLIRNYNHDNLYYSPTLHTLDYNVKYGAKYGSGYDGRLAGKPFAKNAGSSNDARQSDPTSMILSSSSLPQHKFYGGQPIDVNFGIDTVRNHKSKIKTLINVYMERGGLQFQVNSVSSKLLRDATKNPDKYPNLIVRIGGYSIYFNNISEKSKKEFIERFEKEEI